MPKNGARKILKKPKNPQAPPPPRRISSPQHKILDPPLYILNATSIVINASNTSFHMFDFFDKSVFITINFSNVNNHNSSKINITELM